MNKPKISFMINMISHPGCFSDVSCINFDGSLNEERVHYFANLAKASGANMIRMLPCLMDDPLLAWVPGAPFPTDVEYNYTPWHYHREQQAWDLSRLNDLYFFNLARICDILNGKGITLIFPMYDRCHWDQVIRIDHSPWNDNVNMISTFWNIKSTSYNEFYENRVLTTLKGKDFYLELVNEPRKSDLNLLTTFTGRLHQKLLKFGIPQSRIISGVEYFLNGMVSDVYEAWRHKLQFEDSKEGGKKDSEIGHKTIHNFMDCFANRHVLDTQVHSGKYFMSTDGNITTEEKLYKTMMIFFNRKEPKENQSPRFIWEYTYQGIIREKDRDTGKWTFNQSDMYGCRGIARALHDYFYANESPWYENKITLIDPGNPAYPPAVPPVDPPAPPSPTPGPPAPSPPATPNPRKKFKLSWRFYVGAAVLIGGSLMVTIGEPWPLWLVRLIGMLLPFLAAYTKAIRQNKIEI